MDVLYVSHDFRYPNFRGGFNTCQLLMVVGALDGVRRIQVLMNQDNFEESRGANVINAVENVIYTVLDTVLLSLLSQRPDLRGLSVEWFSRVVTDDPRLNHVMRVRPALKFPSSWRWGRLSTLMLGRPQCAVGTASFCGSAKTHELLFAELPAK